MENAHSVFVASGINKKMGDWRVSLTDTEMILNSEKNGQSIACSRAEFAKRGELVDRWAGQAVLKLQVEQKKVQLRLTKEQVQSFEAWLGIPTEAWLRFTLRRRFSFSLVIAIIIIVSAIPLPADPETGSTALPFDSLSAVLGAGLVLLWVLARTIPRSYLFLLDACWLSLLALKSVYDIANGASVLWLLLVALLVHLAWTGIRHYKRFRVTRRDDDAPIQNKVTGSKVLPRALNIFVWVTSLTIAAFYIVSSAGWFMSMYIIFNGGAGEKGRAILEHLNVIDHTIRTAQVLLISVASVLLILRKRHALNLFLVVLALSFLSTVFVGLWGITFLGGIFAFALLAASTGYVYWLFRRGVLK